MKAGTTMDLFPRSYQADPLRPVRHDYPPKIAPLALLSLSPSQGKLPSKGVNIGGTGFTEQTLLYFDGVGIPYTLKSSELLDATFSASVVGDYPVVVRSGGDVSATLVFTFK